MSLNDGLALLEALVVAQEADIVVVVADKNPRNVMLGIVQFAGFRI